MMDSSLYEDLFNTVSQGLVVFDADTGAIRATNRAFRETTDLSEGELSALSFSDLCDDGAGQTFDQFRSRAGTDSGAAMRLQLDNNDSQTPAVEIHVSEVADHDALVGVVQPVTGLASTDALPEVGHHLNELLQTMPDVMWMFDADWSELVYINPAYEDLYGQSIADLRADPQDFLEGVHPEDRERVRDAMEQISAGAPRDIEYRVDPTSEFQRHVWVRSIPIENDDGDVERVAGFTREITERKQQHDELIRQRNLIESIPIGVFRIELTGDKRILQVNPALESMLDATSPGELLGKSVAEFYYDEGEASSFYETLTGTGSITAESRFETLDEHVFWGRVTTVLQTDHEGEPVADGVIEDITARKHRQQQLRVIDRILRHNIRNDVSVIMGYANYLDQHLDTEYDKPLQSILDHSDQLMQTAEKGHRIVDVLSDVGDTTAFDIVPDLCRTVRGLEETYSEAHIEVDLPAEAYVLALNELELAIGELVENSIVHTDEPRVSVEVERQSELVSISVHDDGSGIPRSEYNALSSATESDPLSHGSGVGLWLVHWIVELSGGDISFESNEHGSEVTITVHRAEAAGGDEVKSQAHS